MFWYSQSDKKDVGNIVTFWSIVCNDHWVLFGRNFLSFRLGASHSRKKTGLHAWDMHVILHALVQGYMPRHASWALCPGFMLAFSVKNQRNRQWQQGMLPLVINDKASCPLVYKYRAPHPILSRQLW